MEFSKIFSKHRRKVDGLLFFHNKTYEFKNYSKAVIFERGTA
jgi:hypothetical protein